MKTAALSAETPPRTALRRIALHQRSRLRAELLQVPGLFALLMKPRNGAPWTADERMLLRARLHALSHLSLYLALLALPGTALLLPLLAWWLDRRRRQREPNRS
ncbi:MAG: hypothetical protein EPN55_03205 [Gammaproteobacteria bacterium]|nr:MAG: hypothetical protein EPN55_03205 [Gammaproteobacteria bacterium]